MTEPEFNLDSNDILSPNIHLEASYVSGVECRELYIQTFEKSPSEVGQWRSFPQENWYHIATIYSEKIDTYPAYLAPYTQRYLTPKHGRIAKIIYQRNNEIKLPNDADSAYTDVLLNTPRGICDDLFFGCGLSKELLQVWRELLLIKGVDTIEIVENGKSNVQDNVVKISLSQLNEIRLDFNRADRLRRSRLRAAKKWHVRNEILNEIDPDSFPRLTFSDESKLVELKVEKGRRKGDKTRHIKEKIEAVKQDIERISIHAPRELFSLHSEIERITLSGMIDKFEIMLQNDLSEPKWQLFFEDNTFVLTMLFARPVHLLHKQFHARPSNINGLGDQIGDFLFGETSRALAIVEIKKPTTELVKSGAPYRNNVYAPHYEISGAITQVLTQKSSLQNEWFRHAHYDKSLSNYSSDVIKCIVLAGKKPANEDKLNSFNLFRNSCKDVDIITYDELLEKLKILLSHLNQNNL